MMQLFGMTLPVAAQVVSPQLTATLALRMKAAEATLERGASAAVSAGLRQDARDFLDARRRGTLRLPVSATARACDAHARTLLRLTVDAPPVRVGPAQLVA
jgi:hypothetical protein